MIKIVSIGSLKEKYLQEAEREYLKRLGRYAKLETAEIKECTGKNSNVAKRREAEKILEKTSTLKDYFKVALDQTGKQLTSEEFSKLLEKPRLLLIIGGPEGMAKEVLEKTDMQLSLSKMTFTHQMARIFLLEQIYRGFTILKNEKYHR